ncbi:squalene/phytoene synthase family protein [uncultured Maritalea sp.]|jgi:phytoene synthase|uniref:phytoene/squalene synthase family protein n=1 Tax=uncultured Maritalea sp. TaxID=757249 RepID=UPI0026150D5E|nr:squalene/phytoene synthase family protein [uncultured Maritalea sp.]
MQTGTNQRHVAEELNKISRDDYLATLFMPEDVRPDVQALAAFAAELRVVRQRVSEPTPGEIRLQWWHDALEGKGHGTVRANPIADRLLVAIEKHRLPTVPLKRMIAAHRFDLYDDPMPDVNQFEGYAGETRACIFQYFAMMLGDKSADPAIYAEAAGHLGVATTYTQHLLAFGYNSAKGQIYLPLSVFNSFGIDDKSILAGQNTESLRQAIGAHGEAASAHLALAQNAIKLLPKPARIAFVQSAVCALQLRYLRTQKENPFVAGAGRSEMRKMISMFAYAAKN